MSKIIGMIGKFGNKNFVCELLLNFDGRKRSSLFSEKAGKAPKNLVTTR